MTAIEFNLPDKYQNYKTQIIHLINERGGDFNIIETKDGYVFSVGFDSDDNGKIFKTILDKLLPDLYKY